MGGKGLRWNVLEIACHRMGAIIGHPRTVSNGHDTFWAESELDSCLKIAENVIFGWKQAVGGKWVRWNVL